MFVLDTVTNVIPVEIYVQHLCKLQKVENFLSDDPASLVLGLQKLITKYLVSSVLSSDEGYGGWS